MNRKTDDEIKRLCVEYNVDSYIINPDGSIDVDDSVVINVPNIREMELTFNKVSGSFYCDMLGLTSLKGSPREVGGYFDCSDNDLESLEHCPDIVHSHFNCERSGATIKSLEFFPSYIGGYIYLTTREFIEDESAYARLYAIYTSDKYPKYPVDASIDHLSYLFNLPGFIAWVATKNRIDTITAILEE